MPPMLSGLIPACHTPFDRSGELDVSIVPRQVELFRECGMNAVFVAGTTGEFSSLTVDERLALCDRWTEVAGDSMTIAVHVGHNCQADAIALAKHAKSSGAAAVAAVAPSYIKPAGVAELVDFMTPIAAAADPLPFYYYEIPGMTNVRIPAARFLVEGRARIPTMRGLKFSHNDLVELQECLAASGGEFEVVFGFDEFLLAGLAMGVRGAVGSTYNFAGPHYRKIMTAFESGDHATARSAQHRAARMIEVLSRYGFMTASKATMRLIGIDCGPVRAPLRNLSPQELTSLARELFPFEMFARPIQLPE